jgi:hypothetical protein
MNRDAFDDEDAAGIRQCFQQLADRDRSNAELSASPLPSPELIWWRARLAEKRRLTQRSLIAIETVAAFSIAVAAVFVAIVTLLWAPRLFAALPLPIPLTVTALLFAGCCIAAVLLAWSRQRYRLGH